MLSKQCSVFEFHTGAIVSESDFIKILISFQFPDMWDFVQIFIMLHVFKEKYFDFLSVIRRQRSKFLEEAGVDADAHSLSCFQVPIIGLSFF